MFWQEFGRFGRGWHSLREIEDLRRERNRFFTGTGPWDAPEFPAMNIWVQDHNALVTAELPGIDAKDLDISVIGDAMTLSGNRRADELKEGENYHRQTRRRSGSFARTIKLPFRIEASFSKGILTVNLPKIAKAKEKTKKVPIKTGR